MHRRHPQSCSARSGFLQTLQACRDMLLDTVEEALLRHYLDSGQFSQRELARMLSISRVTLRKKLDKYGLS